MVLTVQSSRAGVTWPNVPVAQSNPGEIQHIEEGWHVALEKCDDGLWVVVGVLNTEPDLLPNDLNASERSMKFDDGTEISTRKNDAGDYDVNIKASGKTTIHATGDVEITSDGNTILDAAGDVTIGDAANAVKLAVQNHTHNYSWTDSGGSGTTDSPNELGTETAVE